MGRNRKPRSAERGNPNEALLSFISKEYRGDWDFAILKKHSQNANPLLKRLAKIKLRQISLEGRCP